MRVYTAVSFWHAESFCTIDLVDWIIHFVRLWGCNNLWKARNDLLIRHLALRHTAYSCANLTTHPDDDMTGYVSVIQLTAVCASWPLFNLNHTFKAIIYLKLRHYWFNVYFKNMASGLWVCAVICTQNAVFQTGFTINRRCIIIADKPGIRKLWPPYVQYSTIS